MFIVPQLSITGALLNQTLFDNYVYKGETSVGVYLDFMFCLFVCDVVVTDVSSG